MATTIKEIASLIGVSRGTVDRVLHNRGRVSPEVREKVYAAIKELGYEPNKAGRMLAAKKNPCCIGVFCPGSYNSFFDEIIRGMEEATEEYRDLGFSLKVSMVRGFDTEDHLKGLEDLVESGINALVSAPICNQQIIDYLSSLKIPSAVFNTDLDYGNKLYYVGSDYAEKGRIDAGLLMLTAKVKPRIIIVRGSDKFCGHSEIGRSFIETLETAGFDFDIVGSVSTGDDDGKTEYALSRLLEANEVNTVFVTTAGLEGAVRAIGDRGILLFTSDDTPIVRKYIAEGKVAWTICQDPHMQGYMAIRKMQDYFISGIRPDDYITQHVIKIRESYS